MVAEDADYLRDAAAVLAAPPSVVPAGLLAEVLARNYGLSGQIDILSSEVECTAEVRLPDDRRLILKVSAQPAAVESFRFQSAAIAAVAGVDGFVAPRVLPTRGQEPMFECEGVCGYLQTRLDGTALHRLPASPGLLRETGRALGQLDLALGSGDLPAMHRPVLWHVRCWPGLMELRHHLPPGPVAEAVRRAMADFQGNIAPRLGEVPWQVTHNDPSPFNTLVTDDGIAFIDFGDGCFGPRIQDLAIAASHNVSDPSLPLGGAGHLIAGYAEALPLSSVEANLLVGLMKARQSALILINYWRSHLFPENAAYINKNVGRAERGLAILSALSAGDAQEVVMATTR
jgi:Ser/Thr protein kinase RdoA (MazF antagonist)